MPAPLEPDRWIAHVDLDAFYASCEQRDHPEYRNRPVVVGAMPGRRGVVAAASYEARAFGIRSAMPISEAARRCPHAVYLRPDMAKYQRVSKQVFRIIETVTPVIEKASIDEAYLDVSGLEKLLGAPEQIGRALKQRVRDETGMTISVGIGPNRLIAKLGSEYDKPDGLTVITPDRVLDFLGPMPVRNLRGLGQQTGKVFERLGIFTVQELRDTPLELLEKHLGRKAAASFRRQARGQASDEIVPDRGRKSISKERTFAEDIEEHDVLHDELRDLAAGVARIARREERAGQVVTLKVRFTGFETHTRQRKLASPTQDERVLLNNAWSLFTRGDLPRKPVRLIGVGISDWTASEISQADLFGQNEQRKSDRRLLDTIDSVAERFGNGKLQLGIRRHLKD